MNPITYVTNPQIDSTNPYALQQRQRLIDALKSQAINPQQMQNSGAVVPRQSLISPLVQALSGYMSGRMQKSQDTAMQGLADKKSSASQALIQSLYGQPQSPQQQPDQSAYSDPATTPMNGVIPLSQLADGKASTMPSISIPQQNVPQQAAPQQQTDQYAAAREKILALSQGINSGTIDPELGKQLLTQAQKDATPPDDFTARPGDVRIDGRTGKPIVSIPDDAPDGLTISANGLAFNKSTGKWQDPDGKVLSSQQVLDWNQKMSGAKAITHSFGGLTPQQNDALYGDNGAVTTGKLDPYKVNSRNAAILSNAYIGNPKINMNALAATANLQRNTQFQQKAMTADTLPEILQGVADAGKKLNYPDAKFAGEAEKWFKGQNNDPDLVNYMTRRNDALFGIAGVMRGNGMTDAAYKAEEEASHPTMSPRAIDAWLTAQNASLAPRLRQYHKVTSNGSTTPVADSSAHPANIQSLLDKYK